MFLYGSLVVGRRRNQRVAFALDTGSSSSSVPGGGGDRRGVGSTRLGRIAIALGRETTILGQTGDWDVLVAGIVVAAIEGMCMLMYKKKKPSSSFSSGGKLQSFVVLMNFWKAGVCLGLFVDAFKLGS
ncbi:Ycf20-like protein [Raphanus sativus]|nr:Ycf20-like protein [Raphanus sativus]